MTRLLKYIGYFTLSLIMALISKIKNSAGANCFHEIMEKEIGEGLRKLQVPFSSGWFLNLSNQPDSKLHWHCDWKND